MKVSRIVFFILCFIIAMQIPSHILYSHSDSLNYNLFIYFKGNPEITKNKYVVFDMFADPEIIENCSPCRVVKKSVCLEGDLLEVKKGKTYYCNGSYIGRAKNKSSKGIDVKNFVYNGKIPKNNIFVSGDSNDSYDSKYNGFIKKSSIYATAYPLF
ncbi:MAG: hypothetical protein GY714_09125 [Desulfobacterales bacterium]|nr:hypothetical protein [Desulfobacterales bacterium]